VFLEGGTVAMAACHNYVAGPRVQSEPNFPRREQQPCEATDPSYTTRHSRNGLVGTERQ